MITVAVTAYNAVTLSGDSLPQSLTASFFSESRSKGSIYADKNATLTLTGWDEGTITGITLWLSSNKSSGAADIGLTIGSYRQVVATGNYNQWPGMDAYSSTPQPLQVRISPVAITRTDTLRINIVGTTNSVALDHVEISYAPTPPVPHTVTLSYLNTDGQRRTHALTEHQPLTGVLLSDPTDLATELLHDADTYLFAGWAEQPIDLTADEPLRWQTDDWYMPSDDGTLYAVYRQDQRVPLLQDTSFTSGEYALAYQYEDTLYFLSGTWQEGRIALHPLPFTTTSHRLLQCAVTYVDSLSRYKVTYTGNTLTVRNIFTKQLVGYTSYGTSTTKGAWNFRKGFGGSLYLYSSTDKSPILTLDEEGSMVVEYARELWLTDWPYWRFFPTAGFPASCTDRWTTFPHITGWANVPAPRTIHKTLENGQIILYINNNRYNLWGQPL